MYSELIPDNWAAQYIDAYWIHSNNSNEKKSVTILPDGCTDIIFSFTGGNFKQAAVGCMTAPGNVHIKETSLMFGIRFKPGCARPFFNISMQELTDKTFPLAQIKKIDAGIITPHLILYQKKLIPGIMEKILKKIFVAKRFEKNVCLAASLIKSNNGLKSIGDIADTLGFSKRHLERMFIDSVGLTPKLFSRIIRFQHANKILNSSKPNSLISVALSSGYYDQAHFCKEYKEFSGQTPFKK